MKTIFRIIYCMIMAMILIWGMLVLPAAAEEPAREDEYTVTNLNIPDGARCFNGHYYYYFDDESCSWSLADTFCFIYGGHLVSITAPEEQAYLEGAYPGTSGWIGASLEGDVWQWTTGEPFEYTHWNEGEPNNQNGEEGYAHLYSGMNWNDLPDTDTTYHRGYYCEWDTDTVTYYRNGLFNGEISDESASLIEEGKTYYFGTGTEGFDLDKAWDCFVAATDDYSGEAWYYIGNIMSTGLRNMEYPYIRAMGAYERAVTYGCPQGWIGMGRLYRDGLGVATDYNKTMEYYKRAGSLGCVDADYEIGYLYEEGLGVEQNYSMALEYYAKAANAGHGNAMYMLGWMYEYGQGVSQDYAMAKYWFERTLEYPYFSPEDKEIISEELTWLVSEESAAAYENYVYTPETETYYNGPYTSDYDYPQGLNGEYGYYDYYDGPYTYDYDFPQGLNGEYGYYDDYYGEPYTLDMDFSQW